MISPLLVSIYISSEQPISLIMKKLLALIHFIFMQQHRSYGWHSLMSFTQIFLFAYSKAVKPNMQYLLDFLKGHRAFRTQFQRGHFCWFPLLPKAGFDNCTLSWLPFHPPYFPFLYLRCSSGWRFLECLGKDPHKLKGCEFWKPVFIQHLYFFITSWWNCTFLVNKILSLQMNLTVIHYAK